MRTTLDLPDALLNEVELRARREGRKLDDAVVELLRRGLAAPDRPTAAGRKPNMRAHPLSGLPYIECAADAPARSMTARDLIVLEREILDREDGQRAGLSA